MEQKKKLIIFDYDGVIVDSMRCNYEIYKIICRKLGKKIPDTFEGFLAIYGKTYLVLCKNLGIITDYERKICENVYAEEVLKQNPLPFQGIREVLEELNKKYLLVVLSASYLTEVNQKLSRYDLLKYFSKAVAQEVKTIEHFDKGKAIENLLAEMKIAKEDVLAIGDREVDYYFAKAAGLKHILIVDYGWEFDKSETPDRIQFDVKEPRDILSAIKFAKF